MQINQLFINYFQWCVDHFLNSRNLMFASDVRHQLAEICESLNISTSKSQRTSQNHEDVRH